MADVIKSIRASGGDYATIAAWSADLDNGAVYSSGDNAIGELYNEVYAEEITISGGGTIGLASITLRAAAGQGHDGTPGTGARVVEFPHVFTTPNIWMNIIGIEFNGNGGAGNLIGVGSGDDLYIERCLIHNGASSGGVGIQGISVGSAASRLTMYNSVVFNFAKTAGSAAAIGINSSSTAGLILYNNTITDIRAVDGAATGIIYADDADSILANNLVTNITVSGSGSTQAYGNAAPSNAVTQTNGSDDASSPQSGLRNLTIAFEDSASDDYRLAAGDTDAIGVGTDLGAGAWATDALGRDRDAEGDVWDLGAFQTFSAGGGSVSLTASPGTLSLVGSAAIFNNSLAAGAGSLSLIGSSAGLFAGNFIADPGSLTLTGSAVFNLGLAATFGSLLLGGGTVSFEEAAEIAADPGTLQLGGGTISFARGVIASSGSLILDGSDILISASVSLDAESGTLTLVAQNSLVDLVLAASAGGLTLAGSASFSISFLAEEGAITLEGVNATLTSTAQTAVAANPGTVLLEGGLAAFPSSFVGAGGVLSLGGGTADLSVLQNAARGALSLIGADAVFNTDVIIDAASGTLTLSGLATLRKTLSAQAGALAFGGGSATLTATQLSQILASPGRLLLVGTEVSLIVTGLTWEGDDATWGGSIAMFGETLPVFAIGQNFFQAGNANAFDLDPIEVILERTGLTIDGVDREGKPRSNPYSLKLLREIWPVIRGTPGTELQVYAGAQDLPEEGIRWQGPFTFVVGQSRSVQPLIEGVYLAVRYRSFDQGPWYLVSHDFDIVSLGVLPQ